MDQNPLLKKLDKFNPDVLLRYEKLARVRDEMIQPPPGGPIPSIASRGDKELEKAMSAEIKGRRQQDADLTRLFSKENFERNRLVLERRQHEIDKLCKSTTTTMSTASFMAMKEAFKEYETQDE